MSDDGIARETTLERHARLHNLCRVRSIMPSAKRLPLQTMNMEFGYEEFFKNLLEMKPRAFKRMIVELLFALTSDVGLMHNDLALLLEDVVTKRNFPDGDIPENRSCMQYDHFAYKRANQYRILRDFEQKQNETNI